MADSSADLLFRISADSKDAESVLKEFRGMLSGNLAGMVGDFEGMAKKVAGILATPTGMIVAGAVAAGTALTAAAAYALHAGEAYRQYAQEIDDASTRTGIAVERMSELRFAAQETHTDFGLLTHGISFFQNAVVQANNGVGLYSKAFDRLGITQAQMAAGQKDIIPLLEIVMDKYRGLSSATERAAVARELMSRGGPDMQAFLALGSAGLKQMADRARELGIVLTQEDITALHTMNATMAETEAIQKRLNLEMGRSTLPLSKEFFLTWALIKETFTGPEWLKAWTVPGYWIKIFAANAAAAAKNIAEAVKAQELTKGTGELNPDPDGKVAKLKQDYEGLAGILDQVRTKLAGFAGDEEKAAAEIMHLGEEIAKAMKKVGEEQAAGTITKAQAGKQLAMWRDLMDLIPQLNKEMLDKIAADRAMKVADEASQLRSQIMQEGAQTLAARQAEWDAEVERRRVAMARAHTDTAENIAALEELWRAHRDKLDADQAKANAKELAELDKQLAETQAKTLESEHRALDRKLDLELAAAMREERATQELVDAIAAVRAAGHAKIERDNATAFQQELAKLDEQLKQIESRDETSQQRIVSAYKADTEKINAAEAEETAKFAGNVAERQAIATRYAALRGALLKKEDQELQTLLNSQGWQGVFGRKFADMIRGNEKLWKEWVQAVHQSHMLVRVSVEAMKEDLQKAFEEFAQGEAGAITNAIVYQKSVGEAMEAALKSTLASLAAQAAAQAIYCTGWGLWDLAIGDYKGAGQAFAAAAIFGSLAGAAAVSGRVIPGGAEGATGAEGGGAGDRGGAARGGAGGAGSGGYGTAAGQGGMHVTVNVAGSVIGPSGMQELASMLNDAVMNQDVHLTATNTRTGVQVTR